MIRLTDTDLERMLADDMPYGDLTTRSLGLGDRAATITLRSGADLVVAASEEAARMLRLLGCEAEVMAASGRRAAWGDLLVRASGPAESILAGWKVAQTVMEYAAGIATRAAAIVDAARAANPDVVVACTRKVFPGTKAIALKAILAGGAVPHRLGLSDTVLLFPEHLALLDGMDADAAIIALKRHCPEKKVVIEVTTPEDAERAAASGADLVQLEKFPVWAVADLAASLKGSPCRIAVAGGVNAANAGAYAGAGAHVLVTSAPYGAPPLDIKAAIAPAPRNAIESGRA